MTISDLETDYVQVAVGVVINKNNQVLISKRHDYLHQGGLWEFPGGKVESFETPEAALKRELLEELNLNVTDYRPLITIPHEYSDKQVYLNVYITESYSGTPQSNESQEFVWADIARLSEYAFPAANKAIISAIQLPEKYVITGRYESIELFEKKIQTAVDRHTGLIQLRQKEMSDSDYLDLAKKLLKITEPSPTKLILNSSFDLYSKTNADGLHYTGQRLRDCKQRPVAENKLFSVSTHTLEELKHAVEIGADFAMLSPVLPTQSHPGEPALGWEKFRDIVDHIPIPVYALGGMNVDLLECAYQHGAQGIAAISALWNA